MSTFYYKVTCSICGLNNNLLSMLIPMNLNVSTNSLGEPHTLSCNNEGSTIFFAENNIAFVFIGLINNLFCTQYDSNCLISALIRVC